ncbi:hypothetical protein N7G274_007201 [Stereocaulon virgatum]|uniref:Uncharacterized protein n=1 Tax=Stereocaulon virgatum TaxID=373712 RepID=A0ABR4AAB9_9LECA
MRKSSPHNLEYSPATLKSSSSIPTTSSLPLRNTELLISAAGPFPRMKWSLDLAIQLTWILAQGARGRMARTILRTPSGRSILSKNYFLTHKQHKHPDERHDVFAKQRPTPKKTPVLQESLKFSLGGLSGV